MKSTIRKFELKWGVPQCVGAIDGSHIPVCAPANLHTDYYNCKGWYSMLVDDFDEQWCVDNEDPGSQQSQDNHEADSNQPHTIRLALMTHFNM